MLRDRNSSAIVADSDIERARALSEDTLDLELTDRGDGDMDGLLGFRTGDTRLTVYRSDYAGSNKANAVTWAMDGVHSAGEVKLAWFKDPDGNILHLTQGI